jgi:adenylate cyclase class 2
MATEIEAKMAVMDPAAVRQRLEALGARLIRIVLEENIFLDNPTESLRHQDCGLRIRINHPRDTGDGSAEITYKGPRHPAQVKQREELELYLASDAGKTAEAIFNRLGYAVKLRFEKCRERWAVDGCHVELDELPRLGNFVEIEGPDQAQVLALRERLDLTEHPLVNQSYASMVRELLVTDGGSAMELRFEDSR